MFNDAPLTSSTSFLTLNSCHMKKKILYHYIHLYVQTVGFVLTNCTR